jgi:hypothetical protein
MKSVLFEQKKNEIIKLMAFGGSKTDCSVFGGSKTETVQHLVEVKQRLYSVS